MVPNALDQDRSGSIEHNRPKPRIAQLDGLRAVAVLMVFASHGIRSQLLWSGVDLFFVLSGFLITGILLQERRDHSWNTYFSSFYARRARRILPSYFMFLVLTSVLFGVGWLRHWYLFAFLMNTTPFFHFAGAYSQGVLWSLAVEEQFYLLWPVAVYSLSEAAVAWLAIGLVVAAPLLRGVATAFFPNHWDIYTGTPFRMDLLAAGALIALAWRHNPISVKRFGVLGFSFAGVVAIALCLLSTHPWFQPGANTVLVNVWLYELTLLGYVGVLLWALSGRFVGPLKWKPLVYLGRISYTVYLVHAAAIVVMRKHISHSTLASLLALGATISYAALSWRFIEQPILRGGKRQAEKDVEQRAVRNEGESTISSRMPEL
jgi:peptidoglycan/LPS O-acetylase OafA/YrhL